MLLCQGRYREAREAFHKLAAEDPHSKKLRAALHLAWAYEHKAEGRLDAAVRELDRVLALDPDAAEAAAERARLAAQAHKSGGILSKLFGR